MQISGFFVGVSAPLVGGALECGVNYLTYTSSLHALAAHANAHASAHAHGALSSGPHRTGHASSAGVAEPTTAELNNCAAENLCDTAPLAHVAAAATVAGLALSFILAPVELVKCRLQVPPRELYAQQLHRFACISYFWYNCFRTLVLSSGSGRGAGKLRLGQVALLASHVGSTAKLITLWGVCPSTHHFRLYASSKYYS